MHEFLPLVFLFVKISGRAKTMIAFKDSVLFMTWIKNAYKAQNIKQCCFPKFDRWEVQAYVGNGWVDYPWLHYRLALSKGVNPGGDEGDEGDRSLLLMA